MSNMKLSTTADVAALLGVSKSSISRQATQHDLGQWLGAQRLFGPADVRKLRKLIKPLSVRPGRKPVARE